MIPPSAALLPCAAADLAALGGVEIRRQAVVAAVAVAVAWATLPGARRGLVAWPLGLLCLAPVPFAAALLFPSAPDGASLAADAARFCLLASIVQSMLLLAAVSAWERFARPWPTIFLDVVRWLLVAGVLVAILHESGVNAGNLFTGSALVTAALGFALKDTLGNVFSGLAIHAERPFEPGDWIQYDANPAHVGRVVEINWRATKVITLDEAFVTIPNGQLAQASIRTFTKPEPWSRRSLFVVTPYGTPPQRVQRIILEAVRGSFGVLEEPAPSVVTNAFTERGVEHWVRLFTAAFDARDRVDGMARDRIWYALARHGIEMPVATHAVRLTPLPPPVDEPAAVRVDRRVECLSRIRLLEPLGPELVRRLAERNEDREYGAGEQVIRQGDPGGSMFVIMAGGVDVTARDGDAPPVALATLGPGDYFGEMSLMTGAPRVATVTTTSETRLLEVGRESFSRIIQAHPELVEDLGRSLRLRMGERTRAVEGVARDEPEPQDIFRAIREFFAV